MEEPPTIGDAVAKLEPWTEDKQPAKLVWRLPLNPRLELGLLNLIQLKLVDPTISSSYKSQVVDDVLLNL